jgi:hypothetical protein
MKWADVTSDIPAALLQTCNSLSRLEFSVISCVMMYHKPTTMGCREKLMSRIFVAVLGCFLSLNAAANPTVGVRLGDVQLKDSRDIDVVQLPACPVSANIPVRQLQVKVKGRRAQINSLRITYYNGSTQELNVKKHFSPGETSRWIDLNGDARCIQKIRVNGDTDTIGWRPGQQAELVFFGKR